MQKKSDLEKHEVIETSSAMDKVEPCRHDRSRPVFRLLIRMHGTTNLHLNQEQLARTSSPTASSVIHPIDQGHHQKKCHADTQERGSQKTEKMQETVIQSQTKHMEIGRKKSGSPFQQKEQSLLRRAIRSLFILFIILGVIVIFLIASQDGHLEAGFILRSCDLEKCKNGFLKLHYVGNPPV